MLVPALLQCSLLLMPLGIELRNWLIRGQMARKTLINTST